MSAKVFLIVGVVITAIPFLLSEFVPAVGEYGDDHSWIYGIAIFWFLFALRPMQKYYDKKRNDKKDSKD
jgi:hypothetical protein